MTPAGKPRTGLLKPLALRARAFCDDSRVLASDRVIRQHQPHTTTDAKWVHFKRPSWGHCKRPLPASVLERGHGPVLALGVRE